MQLEYGMAAECSRGRVRALCSAGEDSQEGCGSADESSQVREDRGHGQHDVPQRGVGAAQSAISLLLRLHLRQFTRCLSIRRLIDRNEPMLEYIGVIIHLYRFFATNCTYRCS